MGCPPEVGDSIRATFAQSRGQRHASASGRARRLPGLVWCVPVIGVSLLVCGALGVVPFRSRCDQRVTKPVRLLVRGLPHPALQAGGRGFESLCSHRPSPGHDGARECSPPPIKTLLCAAVATSLTVAGLTAALAPQAAAATICDSLKSPVYQRFNPATRVTLLTTSATEAATAARNGFTENHGTPFRVSTIASPSLAPARLLVREPDGDRIYIPNAPEADNAVLEYGYQARGTAFHVAANAQPCIIPVYRYYKSGRHTYASTSAEISAITKAGWIKEGATF